MTTKYWTQKTEKIAAVCGALGLEPDIHSKGKYNKVFIDYCWQNRPPHMDKPSGRKTLARQVDKANDDEITEPQAELVTFALGFASDEVDWVITCDLAAFQARLDQHDFKAPARAGRDEAFTLVNQRRNHYLTPDIAHVDLFLPSQANGLLPVLVIKLGLIDLGPEEDYLSYGIAQAIVDLRFPDDASISLDVKFDDITPIPSGSRKTFDVVWQGSSGAPEFHLSSKPGHRHAFEGRAEIGPLGQLVNVKAGDVIGVRIRVPTTRDMLALRKGSPHPDPVLEEFVNAAVKGKIIRRARRETDLPLILDQGYVLLADQKVRVEPC